MWRARGLLVDRMVPDAFAVPMLAEDVLRSRMPRTLQLPGVTTRTTVTEHDQNVALDVLKFVTGFVAEMLPAQIVLTDSKPSLPNAASALAVATVDGEQEFLGSFDFVVRMRSGLTRGTWSRWDGKHGAIDIKITGASEAYGLNSPSMRRFLIHGRLVLQAARKIKNNPIGACSFAGYLIRRPPGPVFKSRGGRVHAGSYGFAAYDVEALLTWNPETNVAPKPFLVLGSQLIAGACEETAALPAQVLPPPRRPAQVNRWELLRQQKAIAGWCTLHDFIDLFKLKGRGDIKFAANRAAKRLREANCELRDAHSGKGRSRPLKQARVCDIQRVYPEHTS